MTKRKNGNIELNGVQPAVHEYAAFLTLAKTGKNIKLIPPSTKFHTPSPDFKMDNLSWELKCPQGKGKYLIRDTLRQAARQSPNVVIDLRRIKLPQEKALTQLNKHFLLEKRLNRILIITKTEKILDIQK